MTIKTSNSVYLKIILITTIYLTDEHNCVLPSDNGETLNRKKIRHINETN